MFLLTLMKRLDEIWSILADGKLICSKYLPGEEVNYSGFEQILDFVSI